MQPFAWTEPCVIEMLQALKNKEVSVVDVVQFFMKEFHVTKGKQAIYNHMPATASADMFLGENDVISLQSKYGNKIKAVREGSKFRVFKKKKQEGIYECLDCRHTDEDDGPKPLPTLKEKDGCYMLNKGIHHITCFLWNRNELIARNIDRRMREKVQANPSMKPQEAHEKGQQEALQLAKEAGQTGKEQDSIAVLFQPWQEVRNNYYRRRKMAGCTVTNPLKPPQMYHKTYRAVVMESDERWLSLADEETGVIVFAADDDYRAAAECTLLMADGTFDLCPKKFLEFRKFVDASFITRKLLCAK